MKTFANFKHMQMPDEAGNALIEAGVELVKLYSEGKKKDFNTSEREDYESKNKKFNESFVKYAVETSGVAKFTSTELLKNPMVYSDAGFLRKFNSVIAQILTPVAPAVVSEQFMAISEVKQIGWGETARFIVKPNDLFMVNDIAEGVKLGGLQRLYNNEATVNPTPKQIRYDLPFYHVAAGIFDWGEWGYKIGVSFGGYVNALVIKTFTDIVTAYGVASSPYVASGFSDANWNAISQKVSTANDNAEVYAMGSLTTLGKVLPTSTLQYALGPKWADQGFLDKYHGVRLVMINPAQVPGTVNTTAKLIVPDGSIYFIGMGTYKPVKIVFEGENVVVETVPTQTADKTGGMAITMRLGVASVVGSRFGAITGIS